MSWKDRVKSEIVLDSPEGESFTAFWIGDPRKLEKRLGFFDYPKSKGTKIQDLGSGSMSYTLTLYFEGEDNDLDSQKFIKACEQIGPWSVDHPILGRLVLQLATVGEGIAPVDSGNVTVVETEWLEPLLDKTGTSLAERRTDLNNGILGLNIAGSAQLNSLVEQAKATQVFQFAVSVQKTVTAVTENLKSLYEKSSEINAQISSVRRSITSNINQTVIDVTGLAGEIQTLIQLPTLVSTDISARFSIYSNMASDLLNLSPAGVRSEDKNTAAIQEAALVGTLGAVTAIAATGRLDTRKQAIDTAIQIETLFNSIVDGLDATQENFEAVFIDQQFFSQSSSYADAAALMARTIKYLLLASYDLSIEKKIRLTKPRAAIEIAISEYGSLGVNDINFDLFIASNNLKGNEILLLPAGREVVVYV